LSNTTTSPRSRESSHDFTRTPCNGGPCRCLPGEIACQRHVWGALGGGDGPWPTRSPLVQVGRQPDQGSLS
jgi:hypothetical protein